MRGRKSMTQISIQVGPGAKMVRAGLQNLQKEIPLVGRKPIYEMMKRIQDEMQKEGDKRVPGNPVHWDSLLQQRAFFASNGFGGGIPHQRTGAYQSGMVIEKTDRGYIFISKSPETQFIGGDAYGLVHSEINKPQNWPNFRDAVDEQMQTLPAEVQAELRLVKRRSGF